MASITAKQIKAIAGRAAKPDLVNAIVRGWPDAVRIAGLTTQRRAACFLGEIMTETGGLQILSESGAYSASRISQIFGVGHHSARVTPAEAQRIAALPIAQRGPVLFNRVYGTGNPTKSKEFRNTGPNDGWLYRGGGMMQCTGKSNYAVMAKKTGMPLVEHPELLHNPDSAFKAAYLEWAQDGRCNAAADRGDVPAVRKIINGGSNGLAEARKYTAVALEVLADYSADEPMPLISPPEAKDPDLVPLTAEPTGASAAPPNVQPVEGQDGDAVLREVQQRLKRRRYPPGVIDGRWGSGTSGALSGFMNDRGNRLDPMPTSVEEFHDVADEVQAELLEAEGEDWYRPVSPERAEGGAKIVKELAPETVPVKRNFLTALWGSITLGVSTLWETVSGYVMDTWNFFTDHKDVIDDHPGIMSTVWSHVASVPPAVWLLIGAGGLAFIAFNSWSAIRTSTQSVKNGERQ